MRYQIKNLKTSDFCVGDRVFVVGWPQINMKVRYLTIKDVMVIWWSNDGILQQASFPPEMLQHYCFTGLVRYGRFDICLN